MSTAARTLDDAIPAIDTLPDVLSRRVNADPERVERGLAQLVLTVVELLRQLMERQALRRIEGGTLDDDEVVWPREALMKLEERMGGLTAGLGVARIQPGERMGAPPAEFGLEPADLSLHLGPLGDLVD